MHRRSALLGFICALALAPTLIGCGRGGPDGGTAEPWVGTDAPWLQSPGTPLSGDLVVPQGARLIGPVFSTVEKQSVDGRSQWAVTSQAAFLLADSDIGNMATDLVDQANPTDDSIVGSVQGGCYQEITRGDRSVQRPYRDQVDPEATAVVCSGSPLAPPEDSVPDPGWDAEYWRSQRGLHFEMRQDVAPPFEPALAVLGWQDDVRLPEELPPAQANVAGPDSVDANVEGYPDLRIVAGSFLAGPPGWGSITGGYTAVIGVSGDADEVFEQYVEQAPDPHPYVDVETMVGPLRFRQFKSAEAGGVWFTVTLNEIDGGAWILVEAYND
jgi:hypothetical protein